VAGYIIDVNWDADAGVWYAICDDIPVALESNSFDALIERVKVAAHEILELNNMVDGPSQLCFKTAHSVSIA